MGTSAMAAAFSIISLVIFFAPCACACAHRTPGNSVPASPIPEHVFMKFRRSSMLLLLFEFFFRRVPYHTNSSTRCADHLLGEDKADSSIGKTVVRCRHLERSIHGAIRKIVRFFDRPALDLCSPAS